MSGKLTAEQVRDVIFGNSFTRPMPDSQYYAIGIDMQAIADELNAALGNNSSRWFELFGTPERAARTLAGIVTADGCVDCALLDATCCRNKDAWLEWLKEDS